MKAIFLVSLLLVTQLSSANSNINKDKNFEKEVNSWTQNYERLIKVLNTSSEVGQCVVTLSQIPSAPEGSWLINFLIAGDGIQTFEIDSPKSTRGESRTEISGNQIHYSISDIAGWTNLYIELDSKSKAHKLWLNKSLPDGTIYNHGLSCE